MSKKSFLTLSNIVFFVYMVMTAILRGVNILEILMIVISFTMLMTGILYYVFKGKDIILLINIIQMVVTNIIFGLIIGDYVCFLSLIALITWFIGKYLGKENYSKCCNAFSFIFVFVCSLIIAFDFAISTSSDRLELYVALLIEFIATCLLMLFKRLDLTLPNHILMGLLAVYSIVRIVMGINIMGITNILTFIIVLCLGIFYFCMLFIPQGKKMVSKINRFYQQDAKQNKELNYSEKESSLVYPNTQDNGNAISSKIAKLELLNSLKDRQAISIDFYEKEKQNIMEGK